MTEKTAAGKNCVEIYKGLAEEKIDSKGCQSESLHLNVYKICCPIFKKGVEDERFVPGVTTDLSLDYNDNDETDIANISFYSKDHGTIHVSVERIM